MSSKIKVDTIETVNGSGSITSSNALVVNNGITIDNITIDGTEIDLSSGNLTIDVAGILNLDAGTQIILKDDGTNYGTFYQSSSDFYVQSLVQDKDLVFYGNDGGSGITALTLDMSDAGQAFFNSNVNIGIGGAISYGRINSNSRSNVGMNIGGASATSIGYYMDNSDGGGTMDLVALGSSYGAHGAAAGEIWMYSPDNINIGGATGSTNAIKFLGANGTRMKVNSSGTILMGTGNTTARLNIGFAHSGGQEGIRLTPDATTATMIRFDNSGGTQTGSITTSGSTTAYNTSSDYRLKENVVTDWDATTRLKQLKPSRFNFKTDGNTTLDGFLAHEVSSIVPEAVSGKKDATQDLGKITDKDGKVLEEDVVESIHIEGKKQTVDKDGNKIDGLYPSDTTWTKTKTEDVYQGVDQSKFVPLLTKALQEAISEIETLKSKVTALESK